MKEIKIKRLTIKNFKGINSFEVELNGDDAVIYGDNATGKTSIVDAWCWLLFDRNSSGESTFDILPLDSNGVVPREIEASVKAEVFINNKLVCLEKRNHEIWKRIRGGEETFSGSKSVYYIDELPVKEAEFKGFIEDEIIDLELVKILTNVHEFNAMHWKKRREILLKLFGGIEKEEVMKADKDFALIAEGVNSDLDLYKRKLSEKIKSLEAELKSIPVRIDTLEQEHSDAHGLDELALQQKLQEASAALDAELRAQASAGVEQQAKLNELEGRRLKILEKQAGLRVKEAELASLRSEASRLRNDANSTCSLCGQPISSGKVKQELLQEIEKKISEIEKSLGDSANTELAQIDAEIVSVKSEMASLNNDEIDMNIAYLETEIESLRSAIAKAEAAKAAQQTINELTARKRAAGGELSEAEKLSWLCSQFVFREAKLQNEKINSHFNLARFKLFDVLVNGNIAEDCTVVHNGVEFGSLNTGAKINISIDIINTLSEAVGVKCPLFVDGAESVTNILPHTGQTITLVVSAGVKQLKVETKQAIGV